MKPPSQWLEGLTAASHRQWFAFHKRYEALIVRLCFATRMRPILYFDGETVRFFAPLAEHYRFMEEECLFDSHFTSYIMDYPISPEKLRGFSEYYAIFYPIYDSYIQIAKGESERFLDLLNKANDWMETRDNEMEQETSLSSDISDEALKNILQTAEQRVRVMPALRWQVF